MMAATFVPIQSVTLASSAASVTFSAIPATYTDLVIRLSARGDDASVNNYAALKVNSLTSGFSETYLYGSGTSASSGRFSAQPYWLFGGGWYSSAQGTINTFSSSEIYLSNYAGSAYKVMGTFTAQENNSSDNIIGGSASLLQNAAAITSLTIQAAANFVAGSTFHLYGIKNS